MFLNLVLLHGGQVFLCSNSSCRTEPQRRNQLQADGLLHASWKLIWADELWLLTWVLWKKHGMCWITSSLDSTLINSDSPSALATGQRGRWSASNQTEEQQVRPENLQYSMLFERTELWGAKFGVFPLSHISTMKLLIWEYVQRHEVSSAAQHWSTSSPAEKPRDCGCVRS